MPKTILVVDDEPSVREAVKEILKNANYSIVEAENGHEALKKIESNPPDLVLCDIVMPEMDGLKLLELVKEKYPEIPFIMLSAAGTRKNVERSMEMGAASYITKAFNIDQLRIQVSRALEEKKIFKSSQQSTIPTNILIVEDDPDTREALRNILKGDGRSIKVATNGKEAFERIKSDPPDLVLCEIAVPGKDGLELLGYVKEKYPEIPFIMLSKFGSTKSKILSLKMGVENYLTKPLSAEEVQVLVSRAIAKRSVEPKEGWQRRSAPSAFIAHSSRNRRFVRKLAHALEDEGIKVWVDEAELHVGDSLIEKIEKAIDLTDFVVAVLSRSSIKSGWVQRELRVAMEKEINHQKVVVLPILRDPLDRKEIPPFLREKLYADFTTPAKFRKSITLLLATLESSALDPRPSTR